MIDFLFGHRRTTSSLTMNPTVQPDSADRIAIRSQEAPDLQRMMDASRGGAETAVIWAAIREVLVASNDKSWTEIHDAVWRIMDRFENFNIYNWLCSTEDLNDIRLVLKGGLYRDSSNKHVLLNRLPVAERELWADYMTEPVYPSDDDSEDPDYYPEESNSDDSDCMSDD